MKDGMRHYAFKNGKIKESYMRKHCDGGSSRNQAKQSICNSIQQSGQDKEIANPGLALDLTEIIDKEIKCYAEVVLLENPLQEIEKPKKRKRSKVVKK